MARPKSNTNTSILEYALHHLEQERDAIEEKISHIQQQLGGKTPAPARAAAASVSAESAAGGTRKKRTLSASARKRIAAAQKKRWAEHRKTLAKSAKSE